MRLVVLRARRQLLKRPGVAVRVGEAGHADSPAEVGDLVHIDASIDECVASVVDVVDDEVQTPDGSRLGGREGPSGRC